MFVVSGAAIAATARRPCAGLASHRRGAEMVLTLVGITMVGVSAATVGATPIVIAAIVPLLIGIKNPLRALSRLPRDRQMCRLPQRS